MPLPVAPVPIVSVDASTATPVPTGVPELDRVLDGGLVAGSVTLLAGEPGMGKSTLLLQALGRMAARGTRCLLVTAEESCAQVRSRAERVGALEPDLLVVAETSLPHVLAHVDAVAPEVLALDSIQTVVDPDLPAAPGSVTQVRDCAYRLVQQAKERALATIIVGHVTKEGTLAGPRVLEHIVDTVLSFDGDRGQSLRLLHALEAPLRRHARARAVRDVRTRAGRRSRRVGALPRRPADGRARLRGRRGGRRRPVRCSSRCSRSSSRRRRRHAASASGIEAGRLGMLLAVLEQHAGVRLAQSDVYASIAGGLRVSEPGVDLALALAVASACARRVVRSRTVAVGELGLGGEVRSVPQLERRLAEACPAGVHAGDRPARRCGCAALHRSREIVPVRDVGEALAAGVGPDRRLTALRYR